MSAKNYEVTGITVHHSQRNQLESSLHDSKNRMDESGARADVAQNEVVQIKNHLDQVQTNYDHQQDVTNQVYQSAYASLMVQLQPLLDEIDSLETKMNEVNTGVDTGVMDSMLMSCLAGIGVATALHKKERKKINSSFLMSLKQINKFN